MGFTIQGYKIENKKTVNTFGDLGYDWDSRVNIQLSNVSGSDRVMKWLDRRTGKALNRNVTNTTAPLYTPSFHNGIPAVSFDGVDDYIRGNGVSDIKGISKITIVMISRYGCFGQMGASANNRISINTDSSIPTISGVVCSGSNTPATATGIIDTIPSIKIMVFDGTQPDNATRLKLYRNKVDLAMTYTGTIPALTDTVGTYIQMGIAAAAVYRDGDIMRALIYRNTTLTPAQVVELSDILNEEYALY